MGNQTGTENETIVLGIKQKELSDSERVDSAKKRFKRFIKSRSLMRRESWEYRLVHSREFNYLIGFLVFFNAVWVGVLLSYDPATVDPQMDGPNPTTIPHVVVNAIENTLCGLFLVELIIRVRTYQRWTYFLTDPVNRLFNVGDLLIELVMIADIWILVYTPADDSMAMRILRIARTLRLFRLLAGVTELRVTVLAILGSIQSIAISFVPMIAVIYTFGVIMTEWCQTPDTNYMNDFSLYFGTLQSSCLTMWQIAFADSGFSIIFSVAEESAFFGILLVLYLIVGDFMILNVLVGVIREVVVATTRSFKDTAMQVALEDLYTKLDKDNDGRITVERFMAVSDRKLKRIGIQRDVIPTIMHQMDWQKTGVIHREVFVLFLLRLVKNPEAQEIIISLKTATAIKHMLRGKKSALVLKLAEELHVEPPISPTNASKPSKFDTNFNSS